MARRAASCSLSDPSAKQSEERSSRGRARQDPLRVTNLPPFKKVYPLGCGSIAEISDQI